MSHHEVFVAIPQPTKIALTCSIFEMQGSYYGFSPLSLYSTNDIQKLLLYEQFFKLKETFKFKSCPTFDFLINKLMDDDTSASNTDSDNDENKDERIIETPVKSKD